MSDSGARFDLEIEEQGGGLPAPLRDPVGVWKRGWRWALITFVLLIIPAVIVSTMIPLQFEAASRLMLTGKAIPDDFVSDTIVASVSEQFQAIQNRALTRKNLKEIIEARGAFAEERRTRTLESVVEDFRNAIQIKKKLVLSASQRESSIAIRISLRGRDPELVAGLVNDISDNLIDEFLEYRNEQSQVAANFMRREFERADEALRKQQRILATFREQNRGSLPEEQPATIGKLERLESQRRSMILQISDAKGQLATSGPMAFRGDEVVPPRARMQMELDRLLRLYTEEHPQIQSLRRQIAELDATSGDDEGIPSDRGPISDPRARIKDEIAARRSRLDEIDAEVVRLEKKVSQTSEITEEYRALEREEVILQESYTDYLRKLKAAELSRSMEMAQQGTHLVQLEAVIPPTGPLVPRFVFTGAALLLALVGSLLVAVARELLNPVVIDSDHLEQITSLPCLGSIPPVT